jgi:hypothetical protein
MRKCDLQLLQRIVETRGGFGHREHVELAWNYLRLYSVDEAAETMHSGPARAAWTAPDLHRLPALA